MAIAAAEMFHRSPLTVQHHSSREDEGFILYQPNPTKQILLYDMATSSSVLTYLKMKNIPFSIRNLTNTEFMSENGRMPVLVDKMNGNENGKLMCGFTEVYRHIVKKLDEVPSLLELAYMDWVETKFLEAEMYICWCNDNSPSYLETYTRPRYTHDLPWPVSRILFNLKRSQMLNNVGKKFPSYEIFLEKFNYFLTKLNKRIGNKPYCLSETSPSCIDALIYGHTQAILQIAPDDLMVDAITKQRRIANLRELINRDYPSL